MRIDVSKVRAVAASRVGTARRVGGAGSIIAGIAVLHGLRTRKWRHIHTFGVALGVASAVAPLLAGKPAGAEQPGTKEAV